MRTMTCILLLALQGCTTMNDPNNGYRLAAKAGLYNSQTTLYSTTPPPSYATPPAQIYVTPEPGLQMNNYGGGMSSIRTPRTTCSTGYGVTSCH
jgi:hypothetical protein